MEKVLRLGPMDIAPGLSLKVAPGETITHNEHLRIKAGTLGTVRSVAGQWFHVEWKKDPPNIPATHVHVSNAKKFCRP